MLRLQNLFVCVLFFCLSSSIIFAQSSPVSITVPINGKMVESLSQTSDDTFIVNTQTGDSEKLLTGLFPTPMIWSPDGTKIAAQIVGETRDNRISYYHPETDNIVNINTGITAAFTNYEPAGWNHDSSRSIYLVHAASANLAENLSSLYLWQTDSQDFRLMAQYSYGQTRNVPILDPTSGGVFLDIKVAAMNPVYDEWVAIGARHGQLADSSNVFMGFESYPAHYLWNIRTGVIITFEDILEQINLQGVDRLVWHPDGNRLLVANSGSPEPANTQIALLDFQPDGTIALHEDAHPDAPFQFVDWLGVDDLLVMRQYDNVNSQHIYSIAQSLDATWHQTEFFTRQSDSLTYSSAWRLEADDTEKYALSCIFDGALPAQLETGQSAITSPELSLLSDPFDRSSNIVQVTSGETVTITGEFACSNGIRFWQVEIASGESGWLPEANTEAYFLQPA